MFRTAFFFLFTIGSANAALKRMRNQSYEVEITNRRTLSESRFNDKGYADAFLDTLLRDYGERNLEMQSMSMSFPVQPERPPAPSGAVIPPPVNSPVATPTTEGSPVAAPSTEESPVSTPIATPTNETPVVTPTEELPVSSPTDDGLPLPSPTEGSPVAAPSTEESPVSTPIASPTNGSPVAIPTDESPVSSPTGEGLPLPSPTEGSPVATPIEGGSLIPTPVEGSPVAGPTNGLPVLTPTEEDSPIVAPVNGLPPTTGAPVAQGGVEPTGAVQPSPELGPSPPSASQEIQSSSPSSTVLLQPDEELPITDSPSVFPTSSNPPSDYPSISVEPSSSLTPSLSPTITIAPSTTPVPTFSERNEMILERCGISQATRSMELVLLFSNVSNPVAGLTPGTWEWWARMWMDQEDGYIACPENDRDTIERYVLVVLYFTTQGDNWGSCSTADLSCSKRWLSDEHHCNWYGVSCNKAKHVTKVVIKDNGLTGPLPSEVFALSSLVQLSLDHNQINGTISSSIGNLDQLQILELDDNKMSGVLPQSLYSIVGLKAIDLNDNTFDGGLSADIANLTELMVLQLENNNLTDPLPVAELSQLEKLILFSTHGNQLAGSFEDICQLLSTRRHTNPTYLQIFATDCAAISCSCCSECF